MAPAADLSRVRNQLQAEEANRLRRPICEWLVADTLRNVPAFRTLVSNAEARIAEDQRIVQSMRDGAAELRRYQKNARRRETGQTSTWRA